MADFEVTIKNTLINVKAQTLNQAANKFADFLLGFPEMENVAWQVIQTSVVHPNVLKLSMTKCGLHRYKVNPNTNKKVIAKLLTLV